ncbi:MAG: Cas8a1 family CRISPR/Cas system-associated protein [Bacilli bacterium]
MKYTLMLDNWLYNAGILGFINIIKNAEENDLLNDDSLKIDGNTVTFDSSILENFEDYYFDYLTYQHKDNLSYFKVIQAIHRILDCEKTYTNLKDDVAYIKDKCTSASIKTAFKITNINDLKFVTFKETKTSNNLDEVKSNMEYLLEVLTRDYVKQEYIQKNIMFTLLNRFYSGKGIFNKSNYKFAMKPLFKETFLNNIPEFEDRKENKKYHNCIACDSRLYHSDDKNTLTFLTLNGVDVKRKASHFYDLSCDEYVCPICNLIYLCAVAGVNYNIKAQHGLFINASSSIKQLEKANTPGRYRSIQEQKNKSIFNLIDAYHQENIGNYEYVIRDTIQIVKLFAIDQELNVEFDILNTKNIEMLYDKKDLLKVLVPIKYNFGTEKNPEWVNIYDVAIDTILRNDNIFKFIEKCLNKNFNNEAVINILININTRSEGMKKFYAKFRNFEYTALQLASRMEENKKNKLYYILKSAARTKDVATFIDALSAAISANGCSMIVNIEDLFDDEYFEKLAYSFISKLLLDKNTANTRLKEKYNLEGDNN